MQSDSNSDNTVFGVLTCCCYIACFVLLHCYSELIAWAWFFWRLGHFLVTASEKNATAKKAKL